MENLQQIWQQYDQKLQQTQAFSEGMLRRMATRHSADRIEKLRQTEGFGLAFISLLLVLFALRCRALGNNLTVQVSYGLVLVQMIGWMAWSIYKIQFLKGLDIAKLSVTETLGRISRFRLMLLRERIWGLVLTLIFFLVPCIVVIDYWITGRVEIFTHWKMYALKMGIALAVGIPIGLWLYRKLYFQPMDTITRDLEEVEAFSGREE